MLSELGHLALAMAVGFSIFQIISPLWGLWKGDMRWQYLAGTCAKIQYFFISVAFLTLITAYLVCDFSIINVFMNAHRDMPWIYRLAGAWGNHEGSLLLWVWVLGLMGFGMSLAREKTPLYLGAMSVQGLLCLMFILFLWWGSDPFRAFSFVPLEGQALNPLLQDRGLALHPPFLYLGYVGFSAVFSFAVAGLWQHKLDRAWAQVVRPWALVSWASLTLGIALGSWWAYYELGWGGWWFWDPVENASLMPWLAGTALIHALRVMEVKDQLRGWTVLLALLTFAFSLLGTFLVRSNLISSVHSFASDPHRGVVILAIMAVLVGGAFLLYALKLPGAQKEGAPLKLLSREGMMIINSLLLVCGLLTVTWGTLYPLLLEALTGKTVSVGAPYFNLTFVPLMLPVLALIPLGMELAWGQWNLKQALEKALHTFTPTFGIGVLLLYIQKPASVLSILGLSLALWLIVASLYQLWRHKGQVNWAMAIGHLGFGLCVLGMTVSATWQREITQPLALEEKASLSGYDFQLKDVTQGKGPNYLYERAHINVTRNGKEVTQLTPEKRLYLPQESMQSESAIYTNGVSDLYTVLGPYLGHKSWSIKLLYHPMVSWIWWGASIMALAGLLALRQRRKVK